MCIDFISVRRCSHIVITNSLRICFSWSFCIFLASSNVAKCVSGAILDVFDEFFEFNVCVRRASVCHAQWLFTIQHKFTCPVCNYCLNTDSITLSIVLCVWARAVWMYAFLTWAKCNNKRSNSNRLIFFESFWMEKYRQSIDRTFAASFTKYQRKLIIWNDWIFSKPN